jgi:hypothetical protein
MTISSTGSACSFKVVLRDMARSQSSPSPPRGRLIRPADAIGQNAQALFVSDISDAANADCRQLHASACAVGHAEFGGERSAGNEKVAVRKFYPTPRLRTAPLGGDEFSNIVGH